jgi:antitoxin ParD1/3/4
MQIHLPPELEAFIQQLVADGHVIGPDQAIETALWLLKDQYELYKVKREALRKLIDVGTEQLDRGEGIDGELVFSKLQEKIQAHLNQKP